MSAERRHDPASHPHLTALRSTLESPAFSAVLTTASIGTVFFSHAIRSVLGWPGLIGALSVLVVFAGVVLVVRRDQFEWQGILPLTLLAFVGWSALSIVWSQYQWSTLTGILFQLAVALLAVFVALARDLIQIVRAFGDVFRVLLATSLIVEMLSGIIFDVPIQFLGVAGRIAAGGPIEGVMGSRNLLGIVTMIAAVTFAIEGLTRSIPRHTAIWSLVLSALVFSLTRSPTASLSGLVVGAAALALLLVRRTASERRPGVQIGIGVVAVLGLGAAYLLRAPILALFNAGGELSVRLALWRQTTTLSSLNFTEGWGWVGYWRPDLLPFSILRTTNGRVPSSALNAYLDVAFQLGIIGAAIFALFLGLALVRAWLVASTKRNVTHIWPALVLVALTVISLAESVALVEYCWFLLVVCAVKAAQELSWRNGLR
jgi:exopolysaccharide production protein ExoQ